MTKEEKQQKKIAEGMTDIQLAAENLGRYAATLDEAIDHAALNNEDQYSDSLIEQKIAVMELKSDFDFIYMQLKDQVSAAAAFNSLKNMPEILDACKKITSKVPNMSKLSKSMSSFRDTMKQYSEDFKKLRNKLSESRKSKEKNTWANLFSPASADTYNSKIEAEKQARAGRLALKAAGQASPAETPKATTTDEIDSIMRGIEQEKGKK